MASLMPVRPMVVRDELGQRVLALSGRLRCWDRGARPTPATGSRRRGHPADSELSRLCAAPAVAFPPGSASSASADNSSSLKSSVCFVAALRMALIAHGAALPSKRSSSSSRPRSARYRPILAGLGRGLAPTTTTLAAAPGVTSTISLGQFSAPVTMPGPTTKRRISRFIPSLALLRVADVLRDCDAHARVMCDHTIVGEVKSVFGVHFDAPGFHSAHKLHRFDGARWLIL